MESVSHTDFIIHLLFVFYLVFLLSACVCSPIKSMVTMDSMFGLPTKGKEYTVIQKNVDYIS